MADCENLNAIQEQDDNDFDGLELSDEPKVLLKSIFDNFDADNNGVLNEEEIKIKLEEDYNITSKAVEKVIRSFDQDGDRNINFKEFINMVSKHKNLFYRHVHRYVMIFVVPSGKRRKCAFKRKNTETGLYEDCMKVTKSTVGIIILTLLQFMLYFTYWKEWLIFTPDHRLEVWRYFSYIFTHNSITHLLINLAVQLFVGLPLEMVHKWRVLVIYGAGTLGGCLIQSMVYPLNDLAGASPGVYAILTAHISKIILNFREVTSPVAQLIVFAIFTTFDTIYNYFTYWDNAEISYISHLGGAVCGLLMGIIILKNIVKKKHETLIWYIALILYSALMSSLVALEVRYILFDS